MTKQATATLTDTLNDYLWQCTGAESYYQHFSGIKYTDGVQYMAETGKAYWLIDAIMSYQAGGRRRIGSETPIERANGFQVWRLVRTQAGGAKLTMDDGGQKGQQPVTLITQHIEWTDFPPGVSLVMYLESGVLMLAQER